MFITTRELAGMSDANSVKGAIASIGGLIAQNEVAIVAVTTGTPGSDANTVRANWAQIAKLADTAWNDPSIQHGTPLSGALLDLRDAADMASTTGDDPTELRATQNKIMVAFNNVGAALGGGGPSMLVIGGAVAVALVGIGLVWYLSR